MSFDEEKREINGSPTCERKKFKELKLKNAFIRDKNYWDKENELLDKIKTAVLTVLLVPIRIICIIVLLLFAWSLAYIGIYGYSREDLKIRPLSGWRRKLRTFVGWVFRWMFFVGSAHFVKVKGKRASPKDAPILLGAPHTSFFDALSVILSGPAGVVAKDEAGDIPFYGKLIDMAQPIYVRREDPNSRATTIQDILTRVKSSEDWPQIMIFPEGTCTNRTSLIQFKLGAFYPGLPIQPVCIRYPNKIDTFTWTWKGPHVLLLIWRTLAQFHTIVELEYLPVYTPSEEEKKNPKLFALNVQNLMSKSLNIPTSDYTFDDCKLMEYAQRCKLQFADKLADMLRLREKIGLAQSQIEEYIVKENFKGNEDYYFEFSEFVQRLKIPADDISYTLFKLFVSESDIADVIDFKEYLLHALFLIKTPDPKIELLRVMFMLYGDNGRVNREPFVKIMQHVSTGRRPEELSRLFYSLDEKNLGSITFDRFVEATKNNSKYAQLYMPNRNFRQRHKDSR